jgi:hypothetical protein
MKQADRNCEIEILLANRGKVSDVRRNERASCAQSPFRIANICFGAINADILNWRQMLQQSPRPTTKVQNPVAGFRLQDLLDDMISRCISAEQALKPLISRWPIQSPSEKATPLHNTTLQKRAAAS